MLRKILNRIAHIKLYCKEPVLLLRGEEIDTVEDALKRIEGIDAAVDSAVKYFAEKSMVIDDAWKGQENIILSDPNILACKDWKDLLSQLHKTKAKIDFNQGIDVRLATEEKIEELNKLRLSKLIHLAWDNPKDDLTSDFKRWQKCFKRKTGSVVYVLTNFNSDIQEDLFRIYTLISLGLEPFVMTYDYDHCDQIHKDLARWVDKRIYKTAKRFEDYRR